MAVAQCGFAELMMIDDLAEAIRNKNVILFVGAGVSMNLRLPSFEALIDHLIEDLDEKPGELKPLGDYLTIAEYYQLQKGSLGSVRSWMDRKWHDPKIDVGASKVHELIVKLDFPIIYTTNYDRWIELAFEHHKKDYLKVINVADLAKRTGQGQTQIVKFHGDFDDDSSIVLTESSYLERLSFESPLDAKLRSDALGHSLLFIGYSLSDINMRYLLYRLQKQWQSTVYGAMRPPSYIFLVRPNPVLERVLASRGVTAIVSQLSNPGQGLTEFLETLLKKVKAGRSALMPLEEDLSARPPISAGPRNYPPSVVVTAAPPPPSAGSTVAPGGARARGKQPKRKSRR
jgi:hypothetical protein